jgi:PEP-CTERM motif
LVSDTGNIQLEILPEPGTLMLVGAGLVGVAFLRRRNTAA